MSESSDPAEEKHYVKMENKKEVEIPRLEYMSDNLAGGLKFGPSPDHIHRGLSRTRAMSCAHLSEIPPHT